MYIRLFKNVSWRFYRSGKVFGIPFAFLWAVSKKLILQSELRGDKKMFKKAMISCSVLVVFLSLTVAFADPVSLNMEDLVQIGDIQSGNNNSLNDAIKLANLSDLEWAGDSWNTSYLLVWDYNEGIFWWFGPGEVTHISIKAGNSWIMYELPTALQAGDFIQLESEIYNKKGAAKEIGHVTGYYSSSALSAGTASESAESVSEPGTILLLGLGLLMIPLCRRRMAS